MATTRHALRERRKQLGWSQERIALALGVAPSTYKSWEAGTSTPYDSQRPDLAEALQVSPEDLAVLLDPENVTAPEGQQVLARLTLHASLEQAASRIWSFQPFTVHALLQSPDYARALERADAKPKSAEGIARRVAIRIARQAVLTREPDPAHLDVILDESVLIRVTGGERVMDDQLDHLAEMASRPNIDLAILPLAAGQHSAGWGSFTVIASQGTTTPQVVCVEDRTGIRYMESDDAVEAHMLVFEHLRAAALSGDDARDLIHRAAKERYQS